MLASLADLSLYRFLCSYWTASDFAAGPLRFVLMHVSADPAGVLEDKADCRALASARCVLRSGAVYAVSLQGPRDALAGACSVLAQALPQHGYDESFFADIDREIASALREAGYGAVRARLERNALSVRALSWPLPRLNGCCWPSLTVCGPPAAGSPWPP